MPAGHLQPDALLTLSCAIARAEEPAAADAELEQALQALFPAARWEGTGEARRLHPVGRGGLRGFIAASDARLTRLPGSLGAIAFELYLAAPSEPLLAESPPLDADEALNVNGTKVVGLVLVDLRTRRLVEKFPGFPLEAPQWRCQGDACTLPSLPEVTVDQRDATGVYLGVRVARQLSGTQVRFFRLAERRLSAVTEFLNPEGPGSESGCDGGVEYALTRRGGQVLLKKRTTCDHSPECADLCRDMGLVEGTTTEPLPLP